MYTQEGHRQRVKERFRKEGLDDFHEVHVLELILFYAVPRRDTKDLARMLLNHFGSVNAVLSASVDELMAVKGVGEGIATYLALFMSVTRYCKVRETENYYALDSTEAYGKYLLNHFTGRTNETVFMLCMDAKCAPICCRMVCEGDVNSASAPIRRMVEIALSAKATMVVLAHNHPSGVAIPSAEDRETTERLATALGAMDIILVDHIVVAGNDFVSMAQSRYYDPTRFTRLL